MSEILNAISERGYGEIVEYLGEVGIEKTLMTAANRVGIKIEGNETREALLKMTVFCCLKETMMTVMPVIADGMSFSAVGVDLAVIKAELKKANQKLDKLLDAPKKNANTYINLAMTDIECGKYEDAYRNFIKLQDNSIDGFNKTEKDLSRIICTKFKILSIIMVSSWSAEKKIFRISDDLDKDSKRQMGISTKDAVEDLLNNLKEPGKTLFSGKPKDYKYQDELDQVLKLAYPRISEALEYTNPDRVLKTLKDFELTILPLKFIPMGAEDKTEVKLGRFPSGKYLLLKLYKDNDTSDNVSHYF